MGFTVECEVGELRRGGRSVRVSRVLVDSGAEFTWLPRAITDA